MSDADVRKRLIPGERQPGMLTTFGAPAPTAQTTGDAPVPMDAASRAEYRREGGGAPSQRRLADERSWGQRLRRALHLFRSTARVQ
jgi:hypothetical protein